MLGPHVIHKAVSKGSKGHDGHKSKSLEAVFTVSYLAGGKRPAMPPTQSALHMLEGKVKCKLLRHRHHKTGPKN